MLLLTASAGTRERRETLQVSVAVAEHQLSGGEPFEPMAYFQLVGHAHAAVQLHRLLPYEPAGLTDPRLGRRQGPPTLPATLVATAHRGEITHRTCLLEVNQHVGNAML